MRKDDNNEGPLLDKEISTRNSININKWIFNMSSETYSFIFKSVFHVIYSNRSKLKGPTKKKNLTTKNGKGM